MSTPEGEELVLKMRAVGSGTTAGEISKVTAATKRANAEAARSKGVLATAGKGWESFGKTLKSVGGKMKAAGSGLTHFLTVPILALGVAATKLAMDFGHQMLLIETQAGAPIGEIDRLTGSVHRLARTYGYGPTEIAKGLYHIESVGFRGAKAIDVMTKALKLAVIGGGDLETTSSAISAVMVSGIKGAGKAVQTLNATVGAGNMRLEDLTSSLGTGILSYAKLAGLGLTDVSAALAVFTATGMDATTAATRMKVGFAFLSNPNAKATKALAAIGVGPNQLAKDLRKPNGLIFGLKDLKQHLDGLPGGFRGIAAQNLLGQIFPAGRGGAMKILLDQLPMLGTKYAQITKSTGNFAKAWRAAMGDPDRQFAIGIAAMKDSLVEIGDAVLPVIVPLFKSFAKYVQRVADWFGQLTPQQKKYVVVALMLVAALGPMLMLLGSIAIAVAALSSPIVLIVIGIIALIAVLTYCYFHFKLFHQAVDLVGHGLMWLFGWAKQHWLLLLAIFAGPFVAAAVIIVQHWDAIVSFVTRLPKRISGAARGLWDGLKSGLVTAINWIIKQLDRIHFKIPDWVPGVGGKSFGINIKPIDTSPRRAESVVKSGAGAFAPTNPLGPTVVEHHHHHTTIMLDGKVLAKSTARQVVLAKAHR